MLDFNVLKYDSFRKLRKEEKQYKKYLMSSSLSSRNLPSHYHRHVDLCTRTTSEHCQVRIFNYL